MNHLNELIWPTDMERIISYHAGILAKVTNEGCGTQDPARRADQIVEAAKRLVELTTAWRAMIHTGD